MVTAMKPVPIGWRVTIDNDPNWITSTVGIAIVGAAEIDPPQLSGMFAITPEPGHACSELSERNLIRLSVTANMDDHPKKLRIASHSMRLVD